MKTVYKWWVHAKIDTAQPRSNVSGSFTGVRRPSFEQQSKCYRPQCTKNIVKRNLRVSYHKKPVAIIWHILEILFPWSVMNRSRYTLIFYKPVLSIKFPTGLWPVYSDLDTPIILLEPHITFPFVSTDQSFVKVQTGRSVTRHRLDSDKWSLLTIPLQVYVIVLRVIFVYGGFRVCDLTCTSRMIYPPRLNWYARFCQAVFVSSTFANWVATVVLGTFHLQTAS